VIRKIIDGFSIPIAALILFIPVSIVAVLLSYLPLVQDRSGLVSLLFFSVAVSIFAVLSIYLLQQLNIKLTDKGVNQGAINFLIIIFIGASRGYLMNTFSVLIVPTGVYIGNRIISSTISTLIWITVFSITINSRNKFKDKFEGLVSQALLNRFSLVSQAELAQELSQIEADLKDLEISLEDALLSSEGFKRVAQEVDERIQRSIRPLSHNLWLRGRGKVPKFNLLQLVRESVVKLNYPFWPLVSILFFFSISNLMPVISLRDSIIRSALAVTIFVLLHISLKLIQNKILQPSFALGFIFMLIITFIPPILLDQALGELASIIDNPIIFASYLILPSLVIILSLIKTIELNRRRILDLIEEEVIAVDEAEIKQIQATQVASYLHNNLANEYRSIGRQIEQLSSDPHSPQARQAIEKLGALINRSISQDFKEFYDSPILRLNKLPEAWQGILDLTLNVPEQVLSDSEKAVVLTQVIEELVSNTAAHLDATSLVVDVSIENSNNIKIIALNNGQFIKRTSRGMGKDWINSISVSQVQEEQTKDGYKVTIFI
jgi:hypothetical protein